MERDLHTLEWHRPPARLSLEPGALHLWRLRADAPFEQEERHQAAAFALLDADQRQRVERLRHPAQRWRYLQVQANLRRILARYLDCSPERLILQRSAKGKPRLAAPRAGIVFNLSTCTELALLALAPGCEDSTPVGIDCEALRLPSHVEGIAERVFTPEQCAQLQAAPEAQRPVLFTRYWTALEADAKCDGRGLFGTRAPQARIPEIAQVIPAHHHIAAVARTELPPVEVWCCFECLPPR